MTRDHPHRPNFTTTKCIFSEEYLRGLRNMRWCVTTQQMLDHLYENYSVITAVDIEYNNTQNERIEQSNLSD